MKPIEDIIDDLLNYFDMDGPEWPSLHVYCEPGRPYWGLIDEELYSILITLREARRGNPSTDT